jgi:hypothetical protein
VHKYYPGCACRNPDAVDAILRKILLMTLKSVAVLTDVSTQQHEVVSAGFRA